MLRQIVSLSLAMTACVTFVSTKANAATLTVIPVGEIQKRPGESIEFIFAFTPNPSTPNTTRFSAFDYSFDGSELSLSREDLSPFDTLVNNTRTIARLTFDILNPVKDGRSDVFNAKVYYTEGGLPGETSFVSGADVVPVPEPLTIFGTAIGLGSGVLFKRKSSKKALS